MAAFTRARSLDDVFWQPESLTFRSSSFGAECAMSTLSTTASSTYYHQDRELRRIQVEYAPSNHQLKDDSLHHSCKVSAFTSINLTAAAP